MALKMERSYIKKFREFDGSDFVSFKDKKNDDCIHECLNRMQKENESVIYNIHVDVGIRIIFVGFLSELKKMI